MAAERARYWLQRECCPSAQDFARGVAPTSPLHETLLMRLWGMIFLVAWVASIGMAVLAFMMWQTIGAVGLTGFALGWVYFIAGLFLPIWWLVAFDKKDGLDHPALTHATFNRGLWASTAVGWLLRVAVFALFLAALSSRMISNAVTQPVCSRDDLVVDTGTHMSVDAGCLTVFRSVSLTYSHSPIFAFEVGSHDVPTWQNWVLTETLDDTTRNAVAGVSPSAVTVNQTLILEPVTDAASALFQEAVSRVSLSPPESPQLWSARVLTAPSNAMKISFFVLLAMDAAASCFILLCAVVFCKWTPGNYAIIRIGVQLQPPQPQLQADDQEEEGDADSDDGDDPPLVAAAAA